jgi:hypothetical protein
MRALVGEADRRGDLTQAVVSTSRRLRPGYDKNGSDDGGHSWRLEREMSAQRRST